MDQHTSFTFLLDERDFRVMMLMVSWTMEMHQASPLTRAWLFFFYFLRCRKDQLWIIINNVIDGKIFFSFPHNVFKSLLSCVIKSLDGVTKSKSRKIVNKSFGTTETKLGVRDTKLLVFCTHRYMGTQIHRQTNRQADSSLPLKTLVLWEYNDRICIRG